MTSREVSVYELKEGDVLGKDIDDLSTGNILVGKGTKLTEELIYRIENSGVSKVFVEDPKLVSRVNSQMSEGYEKIETKIKDVFEDVASGKDVDLRGDENAFNALIEGVCKEGDIVDQLMLLRSSDDYTYVHSMSVGILAPKLGMWLGYSEEDLYRLSVAGVYHDIGMMLMPKEIVNKKGPLTDEEFEIIKKHSQYSYDIVKKYSDFDEDIAQAVLLHHEKMDGSGYPKGISGEKIPKLARVVAICDIYSALTTNRVYRKKDSPFVASGHLKRESFSKLDPHMVRVFVDNIAQFYIGNRVSLSDGREGVIVAIDPVQKDFPLIKVGTEFVDIRKDNLKITDVSL